LRVFGYVLDEGEGRGKEQSNRIILERWMKHSPAVAGDERIED
jgi:hypothetical protein